MIAKTEDRARVAKALGVTPGELDEDARLLEITEEVHSSGAEWLGPVLFGATETGGDIGVWISPEGDFPREGEPCLVSGDTATEALERLGALAASARRSENATDTSAPSTGVGLIAAERRRQMAEEGWTEEHDAIEHPTGELAAAASCYAWIARVQLAPCSLARAAEELKHVDGRMPPSTWPWSATWWKPSTDPIRNLAKAGALVAAEIDRLQREAVG
jgi:hypothetical protein